MKTNKLLLMIIVISILLLVGCETKSVSEPKVEQKPKYTEQQCKSLGGRWGPIGTNPNPSCNLPTSDGGKSCFDSHQCESICIGEDKNSTDGTCGNYKIVAGCYPMLNNGRATILCVD